MLVDISGIILANSIIIFSIYKLNNRKISFKDKKLYVSIILYNILALININLNDTLNVLNYVMPIFNIGVLIFIQYFIMRFNIHRSFTTIIITYSLLLLTEVGVIIALIILNGAYSIGEFSNLIGEVNENVYLSFAINIFCTSITLLLCKNKIVRKIFSRLINFFKKLRFKRILIASLCIFIVILLVYIIICYSNNLILTFVMFLIFLFIMLFISLKDIGIRSEYEDAKEKYNSIQQTLLEYEDMIDKYRVNNHENKNQLLTIQNMLKHNNDNVNQYIDDLVGNVYMTNEKTMMDVSTIPAGGLRATIHTKLNIMDNKNIKYILNIDRKLRTIDFENISSEINLKICKIISIFIDNAIDEVETHDDLKIVNIEMYLDDDKIVVEIINKFKNNFDINKIFERKYTTKTAGHGYGLALAKELIDSEVILNNNYKIEDDLFTQVLEIKLQNK